MKSNNNHVINILLVDDSDSDIKIVKDAFEQAKLLNIVDVVKDGEEALSYLKKEGKYKSVETPGLVLLDINMPKKNGFQVLEEVKKDEKLKQIPIVMLTTSSRDEDVIKSYKGGACSYIKKPVGFQEMSEAIKQFSLYWAVVSKIPLPI